MRLLGCLGDHATDLPARGAQGEQRLDEEVERDRGVGGLHLGDAGLTRAETARRLRLRPGVAGAQLAQVVGEGQTEALAALQTSERETGRERAARCQPGALAHHRGISANTPHPRYSRVEAA